METPATVRRNPPRKAKLTSTEKSTVKEHRTARKRYAAEGKALMPSFTEADGESKLKLADDASCIETLQAVEQVSSIRKSAEEIPASGMGAFETENSQCAVSHARHTLIHASNKVRVFLRIRPAQVAKAVKERIGKVKKASEIANRSSQQENCSAAESRITLVVPDVCLLSHTPDRVTLVTPTMYSGLHKPKEEEFNGFSRIFNPDSTQIDVFDEVLAPRLADLLEGKSSLVVAMGPTSAGKTHTMLGSTEDPGLVPQSLQYLFGSKDSTSMKLVISMFEIYSEQGGRPEKIFDLLQDGAELSLQQSRIKGLHEAIACTAEAAVEIFANGLQRRTTASTAANFQSSRSHCIFNISICQAHSSASLKQGTLTIADLAGFEREKKTKNQGVRLHESSFINNTSMVFGQCLRALLEHQKNPKRTLQRHFQYSMLTRYLKPYMEANGNMTLIVNVSPCEGDYLDTAFVLRQVAPYSKIRVVSMPPKESFESLKTEKRSLPVTERQQPTTKRRKVNGAVRKSIDGHDDANTRKSKKIKSEVCNSSQGLFIEVLASQDERAVGTTDSMEVTRTRNEAALSENAVRDWKSNLIADINHILIQEGVTNFDQITHAITKILDKAEHYHSEDLERRFQDQCAEITLLRTNFLKEQQHSSDLLIEIEKLKEQQEDLIKDRKSSVASSEKTCSATRLISQSNVKDEVQPLINKVLNQDMNIFFSSECHQPALTKKPTRNLHHNPDGVMDTMWERLEDPSFIEQDSPLKETMYDIHDERQIMVSEKVSNMASDAATILFGNDNEQDEGLIIKSSKEDLDRDGKPLLPIVDAQCLHSEGSSKKRARCDEAFEDSEYYEQQKQEIVFSKITETSPLLPTHLESGGSICITNGKEVGLAVCDSEVDLASPALSNSIEGQYLYSENHLEQTKERLAACYQAFHTLDDHHQQSAQNKSVENQESHRTPLIKFDSGSSAAEEKEKHDKELDDCLSLNAIVFAGDSECIKHLSEQVPGKLLVRGKGNSYVSPHLRQPRSNSKETHTIRKDDSHIFEEGSNKNENSNFQKGKLLALALMQDTKICSDEDSDHAPKQVHCGSSSPGCSGTLGPIGHDLEEILEAPLAELEKDLWAAEASKGSTITKLLAKHCGVLDINHFSRKYTNQRANCLRYCLAVVSGKMNMNGTWVPLSKKTLEARKQHFHAVLQARTVAEAAGHARAGIQVEVLSDNNAKETEQMDRDGVDESLGDEAHGNKESFQAHGNKENASSPSIPRKPDKPEVGMKRRRLQPLSSLSLHGGPNMSADLTLADANEPKSHGARLGNSIGTLAYLLTRPKG